MFEDLVLKLYFFIGNFTNKKGDNSRVNTKILSCKVSGYHWICHLSSKMLHDSQTLHLFEVGTKNTSCLIL